MKLSMPLMYAGNPREAADSVVALEKAGLDTVWVAEVYGFDSPTLMGYLAAKTETIEIGSAILNVYSRTPALLAQTAAGLDNVSGGRAILGLGASGPQVIEGWHGMAYSKPLGRTREVVDIVRMALRGERLVHDGTLTLPLPAGQGLGLGKPLKMLTRPERPVVPIYIAALGQKNVQATAEYADGWLPFLFAPEWAESVWGEALSAGVAKRHEGLAPLEIAAGGMVAVGDDVQGMLDLARRKDPGPRWEWANALDLPYADGEFAAATVGFGARNFSDLDRGVAEMARVVEPGGRVVILEITTPQHPPLSFFFSLWFDRIVPLVGKLAGDPDAYAYLPSSVKRFPGPEGVAASMERAGLRDVRWILTAGGIIALHVGTAG